MATYPIINNYIPNIKGAFDSRMLVQDLAGLTSFDSSIKLYKGMIVSVADTGDIYVLKDPTDANNLASWNKIGSGGISQEDLDNLRDSLSGGIQSNRDILGELSGSYISFYNEHQQREIEVDDLFKSLSGDIRNTFEYLN